MTVLGVIVKDGVDGANVYNYGAGATSDTFLTTPNNGDKGISHISFCYEPVTGRPLEITKTVDASFGYTWTIDKMVVGDSTVTGDPGSTATFNYNIVVTPSAKTGFQLGGVITVTNPNAFNVTGVVVTDVLIGDTAICTVTPPLGFAGTLTPGAHEFTYTCAVTTDTATDNKATVAWAASGDGALPADSADFTEPVVWDSLNKCVDVYDDMATADTSDDVFLGDVCVGDPAADFTFAHQLTFTIPTTGCQSFTNTASAVPNDGGPTVMDPATVEVCSNLEGCTPGYWKQTQHFDSWVGFTPNQTLLNAGITNSGRNNTTLVQALNLRGGNNLQGAKDILLRAAVAALLNEANPAINYGYDGTLAELKAEINAALASGSRTTILALASELDMLNNAGCPLS